MSLVLAKGEGSVRVPKEEAETNKLGGEGECKG